MLCRIETTPSHSLMLAGGIIYFSLIEKVRIKCVCVCVSELESERMCV